MISDWRNILKVRVLASLEHISYRNFKSLCSPLIFSFDLLDLARTTSDTHANGNDRLHCSSSCYSDDFNILETNVHGNCKDDTRGEDSSREGVRQTRFWSSPHCNSYTDGQGRESCQALQENYMTALTPNHLTRPLPPLPLPPLPLQLPKSPGILSGGSDILKHNSSIHLTPTHIHQSRFSTLQRETPTEKTIVTGGLPARPSANDLMLLGLYLNAAFKTPNRVCQGDPGFPAEPFVKSTGLLGFKAHENPQISHGDIPYCAPNGEIFGEGNPPNGSTVHGTPEGKTPQRSDPVYLETSFFDHSHEDSSSDTLGRSFWTFLKKKIGSKLPQMRNFSSKVDFWSKSTASTERAFHSRSSSPLWKRWKRGDPIRHGCDSVVIPTSFLSNHKVSERMEELRAKLLQTSSVSAHNLNRQSSPAVETILATNSPTSPITYPRFKSGGQSYWQLMHSAQASPYIHQSQMFVNPRSSSLQATSPRFWKGLTNDQHQCSTTSYGGRFHRRSPTCFFESDIHELDSESAVTRGKPSYLDSSPLPRPSQREVDAETAEAIILRILQHIDRHEDLLAMAFVSASTFRVFKDHELSLTKGFLDCNDNLNRGLDP